MRVKDLTILTVRKKSRSFQMKLTIWMEVLPVKNEDMDGGFLPIEDEDMDGGFLPVIEDEDMDGGFCHRRQT